MRRVVNGLIATALLVIPALALTAFTPTHAPASPHHAHYVAAVLQPNSACAPEDPGTL
jgi:hypothetical protein